MKTISGIILSFIALTIVACGGGNPLDKKKAELEKLKAEQTELSSKIATLEDEIVSLGDSSSTEVNLRTKVIAATSVAKQTFIHAIDVQGSVDGDDNIAYSTKVNAVVTRLNVKVGDVVRAGQIMAELDNKIARAQYESIQKQYELANTLYEKRKSLWDQKVGSEIEYLQAKTSKESLEKSVQSAKETLDMYYLKADRSGTVDMVNLRVGESALAGFTAILVVSSDKLKIKAQLSETYIGNVKQNNPVSINFPDVQKSMKAKVTYASKGISLTSRTFEVEIALPNDNDLHPNMIAELKITDYEKPNSIVVPINTIQQIDGLDVVFVAAKEGNQLIAKKTTVKVGKSYNGLAEIIDGLNEGDQLITTGFQDLTDGQAIKL
jgi:membrane fusion protein (multidrug efflux system)